RSNVMSASNPIEPQEAIAQEIVGNAGQPPALEASEQPRAPRPKWWIVLLAALSAAVIAWLIGETNLVRVKPKTVFMNVMGNKMYATTTETENAAKVTTAARAYGVFGAVFAFSLGTAGALSRRTSRTAWAIALLGAGLG